MKLNSLILALICMLAVPVFAQDAQTSREQEKTARLAAEKAREAAELRVEDDMLKMNDLVEALSKNLGQLHYLRTLCFGVDDQLWRDRTASIMKIEAGENEERRSLITRAFNAGYYQEKERFDSCSKDVSVDAAAVAENARNIATMLGDPFREQ